MERIAAVICSTAITLTFLLVAVGIIYTNSNRKAIQEWQATSVYEPTLPERISHTTKETISYTRSPTYWEEPTTTVKTTTSRTSNFLEILIPTEPTTEPESETPQEMEEETTDFSETETETETEITEYSLEEDSFTEESSF